MYIIINLLLAMELMHSWYYFGVSINVDIIVQDLPLSYIFES